MSSEGAAPTEAVPGQERNLSLSDVTDTSVADANQSAGFAAVLESTLAYTLSRPNGPTGTAEAHSTLTDAINGSVGAERSELSANAVADPTQAGADGSDMVQNHQETRLRDLYLDLAQYQVAWRIVQKIQQDISQLMRGM